jgi:hypothetical protein
MVTSSTNINKKRNYLSLQIIESRFDLGPSQVTGIPVLPPLITGCPMAMQL